jgi:hypothetical protein
MEKKIELLRQESARLISLNVSPYSDEWQSIRNRIYQVNQQRCTAENERFEQSRKCSESQPFCVDDISVNSVDSSGSESSVYKFLNAQNKAVSKKKGSTGAKDSSNTVVTKKKVILPTSTTTMQKKKSVMEKPLKRSSSARTST